MNDAGIVIDAHNLDKLDVELQDLNGGPTGHWSMKLKKSSQIRAGFGQLFSPVGAGKEGKPPSDVPVVEVRVGDPAPPPVIVTPPAPPPVPPSAREPVGVGRLTKAGPPATRDARHVQDADRFKHQSHLVRVGFKSSQIRKRNPV